MAISGICCLIITVTLVLSFCLVTNCSIVSNCSQVLYKSDHLVCWQFTQDYGWTQDHVSCAGLEAY